MSTDTLRRAAALMRERALEADLGPWTRTGAECQCCDELRAASGSPGGVKIADMVDVLNAPHIASWDPTVALAVADWLDMTAGHLVAYGPNADSPWVRPHTQMALAVATAYLNEEPA